MKARTWLTLLIAGGLGAGTAKMGVDLVKAAKAGARTTPGKTAEVVVAAHDLDPGQLLTAGDFKVMQLPETAVPASTYHEVKPILGRATASPVASGQMMFPGLLAAEGSEGGLAALVPPGMRAITVEVSESSGLAGLLAPGCRVDVIATLRHNESYVSRTIVENVKVSAIGHALSKDSSEATKDSPFVKTVTLIVTPDQAEAIELASNSTKPRLVLRGMNDERMAETDGVKLWKLMGENPPEAPQPIAAAATVAPTTQPVVEAKPTAPPEPPKYKVRIIRGGQESTINFEQQTNAGTD